MTGFWHPYDLLHCLCPLQAVVLGRAHIPVSSGPMMYFTNTLQTAVPVFVGGVPMFLFLLLLLVPSLLSECLSQHQYACVWLATCRILVCCKEKSCLEATGLQTLSTSATPTNNTLLADLTDLYISIAALSQIVSQSCLPPSNRPRLLSTSL